MSSLLLLLLFPLALLSVFLLVRWPRVIAIGGLIVGPLLLSTFKVGPLSVDNYTTLVGAVAALVYSVVQRQQSNRAVRNLAIFPLAISVAVLSSGLVNDVDGSTPAIRFVCIAMLAFVMAKGARDRVVALRTLQISTLVGAASVYAAQFGVPFARYVDAQSGESRSGGLLGHPNFAAYVLALVALQILFSGDYRLRSICAVGFLIGAIVVTGSLSAALTLVASWAIHLLLRPNLRAWVIAFCVLVAAASLGGTVIDRLQVIGASGQASSLTWRAIQWSGLIDRSSDSRSFGIGWQQSEVVSAGGLAAHSAYVQTFVELGYFGCALALFGAMASFATFMRHAGAALMVVYMLVASITDPVIFYPSSLTAFLIVLAMTVDPIAKRAPSARMTRDILPPVQREGYTR